jgi:signal transduction histidine kinase/CheY-like chemotaxis protein
MSMSDKMSPGSNTDQAFADVKLTAHQLTLRGMRVPVAAHYVFNGLAALAMAMLGHPLIATVAMVAACGIDTLQQHLLRRWIREGASDERVGAIKLAMLCVARVVAYTGPSFVMATGGGLAELAVFALQTATLIVVAMGVSATSRYAFWGLCAPLILECAALILFLFDPVAGGAVMLSLFTLSFIMILVAENMGRTTSTWHAAFLANSDLVDDLAKARDQAVADRTAADAAREVARRANAAKSSFLATTSHEIRTPMNGVLGMAELLRRDETNPAQAERLAVLIDSGEYLLSILNDILDISKIDAGKMALITAPEDVRAILGAVVGFWGPRADAKGVTLSLRVEEEVPERLMIDALRLRQIVFNLVGNALKFTETGAVEILAGAATLDDGAVDLRISVRDTGPGIAEAHIPVLFDRFSQVEDAKARRFGGSGLGLAIVKQLTELMGGRVWVESTLDRGSTFHIEAPVDVALAAAQVPEAVASATLLGPLSILVVDDNLVNLMVVEQMLASFDHRIAKASSGAEALEALAAEPFDLLISDIQMPEMGGVELLQRLRAGPGSNRDIPAIALTADVTSGDRNHYLALGFNDHSPKPIQIADLLAAMVRAVEGSATMDEASSAVPVAV